MKRGDGLVQRRVGSSTNSNSNQQDNEEEPILNGDYDSSKDTRFTLMEEVLLLGLKDKEVFFRKKYFVCCLFKFCFVGLYILLE